MSQDTAVIAFSCPECARVFEVGETVAVMSTDIQCLHCPYRGPKGDFAFVRRPARRELDEREREFDAWRERFQLANVEKGRPVIVRVPEEWTREQIEAFRVRWRLLVNDPEMRRKAVMLGCREPLFWWRRLLRRVGF